MIAFIPRSQWRMSRSDANYNPVIERTNNPYAPYTGPVRASASSGRWAVASLVAGLLGASFLPAAMIGGGNWTGMIETVMPLWVVCCLAGLGCGIRGMQFGKRTSARQRIIAASGAFISLGTFIVLTLIALLGGQ